MFPPEEPLRDSLNSIRENHQEEAQKKLDGKQLREKGSTPGDIAEKRKTTESSSITDMDWGEFVSVMIYLIDPETYSTQSFQCFKIDLGQATQNLEHESQKEKLTVAHCSHG